MRISRRSSAGYGMDTNVTHSLRDPTLPAHVYMETTLGIDADEEAVNAQARRAYFAAKRYWSGIEEMRRRAPARL
jgi:hypothetical protein